MPKVATEGASPPTSPARRSARRVLVPSVLGVVAAVLMAIVLVSEIRGPSRHPSPVGPVATRPAAPSLGQQVPIPRTGAYLGIYNNPQGLGRETSLDQLEARIGRKFAIDHRYYRWDQPLPTPYDRWTAAAGRIPLINWETQTVTGHQIKWAAIAHGAQDATIRARARELRAWRVPLLLVFQHEPGHLIGNSPKDGGSAADYVAAWRHVFNIFRAEHVNNVSFVWVLTAFNFRAGGGVATADQLYPGDAYVNWIGVDGYNYYNCSAVHSSGWRSFEQVFQPWYNWALPHHKPLIVAEWGVQEDPADPARKGEWFIQAAQQIQHMPAIKAVVYFNAAPACPNWVTSSIQALAGFRTLAHNSYFTPRQPNE